MGASLERLFDHVFGGFAEDLCAAADGVGLGADGDGGGRGGIFVGAEDFERALDFCFGQALAAEALGQLLVPAHVVAQVGVFLRDGAGPFVGGGDFADLFAFLVAQAFAALLRLGPLGFHGAVMFFPLLVFPAVDFLAFVRERLGLALQQRAPLGQ